MTDGLLPWGLTVAGKFTWDSGLPKAHHELRCGLGQVCLRSRAMHRQL
jgi:hypothetical protein